MIKILFVCHGNICRSPMAEFVMKDLVKKAGLSDEFYIASAATSTEEIGNGVPPSEITATSVVPPPMSTTILPVASFTGSPAPIAAAIGSSISATAFAPA